MRSDNGTNFVGAERELQEALAALNHIRIEKAFSQRGSCGVLTPHLDHITVAPGSVSYELSDKF